jgi:hypothetical protein
MKKRIKKLGIFLLFAIPILYFLFTLLFFSPFEDAFGKVEYIIPREVDFYVSKLGLENDVTDFPVPDFYNLLEINHQWRAFTRTDFYRDLSGELDMESRIEEIRASVRDMPIDPIADIAGQEVAVIGTLRQGREPTFLAFFRASNKVKLFYELFTWNWVRGLIGAPMLEGSEFFSEPEGHYALVLADNQEFFMRRCSDLIIAGTDEALMKEVSGLIEAGAASIDLSLGGSNAFEAKVARDERLDTDYLDFHIDLEQLFKLATFDDDWRANDIDFAVMNAVDIFDPSFFRSVTGALRMSRYLELDAKVDFFTDEVKEADTGFFTLQSVSLKDNLENLTSMLPQDVYLAGYMRIDLKKVLQIMSDNLSPDLRKLITDLLREGRRFNTKWDVMELWDLIDKLAATFADSVYFALRPRDVDKPLIPGVQPLPIIAVIMEIEDMVLVKRMEDTLRELQNSNRHNFEMWKYKNTYHGCMIKGITTPGADDIEQIAYTILDDRYFILATSAAMIEDMLKARASDQLSLRSAPKYQSAREYIKGHGNMACYLDIEGLRWALDNYAQYWAEVNSWIDYETERQTSRKKILQREYPKYARSNKLPSDVEKKVEAWVDMEMEELARKREDEDIPMLAEEFRKQLVWIDLFDSVTLTLNVNLNDFDLGIRISSLLSK